MLQVAVIGLSSEVSYAGQGDCLSSRLIPLAYDTRTRFTDFIDKLEKDKSKQHSLVYVAHKITAGYQQAKMLGFIFRNIILCTCKSNDLHCVERGYLPSELVLTRH